MRKLALLAAVAALCMPGTALAGRFAVGVRPGASLNELAAQIRAEPDASVAYGDAKLRALVVEAPSVDALASLPGVTYVERLDRSKRRLAFTPNDPLFAKQWYLDQIRAFDAWNALPLLPGVLVAVLDSGIDARHPEFQNRIADSRSFIGGSALRDGRGHGTFVAGEIAAATGNGIGISGIAFPGELLVAKIARADGTIPLEAEARAIRWAVDSGARVINLSLAGVRDPFSRRSDTYSPLEAAAISYAYRNNALVVAAVGNGDQAPRMPWSYAGYPAALPHVLGISATARDGGVPAFSNRDAIYNDIAAPGADILSTLPRSMTSGKCGNVGYSDCGPSEYRGAEGTSFAAPQAAAAAALLLSVRPGMSPDQVSYVLERSATDLVPALGCRACRAGRDQFTGWGRLDVTRAVAAAMQGALPRADRLEPNDEAGAHARRLFKRKATIRATIDYWDDHIDVYKLRLRRGQTLWANLRVPSASDTNLFLWQPGTKRVDSLAARRREPAARSRRAGRVEKIRGYRAAKGGLYYLEVKIARPGSGLYSLGYDIR